MRLASPDTLNLLWLLIPLFFFLRWAWKSRLNALHRFAQPDLAARLAASVCRRKQRAKLAMIWFVFLFSFLALSRPMWGMREHQVVSRGHDIFIVLDVSRSMLAEDIKPNRLERAKMEVGNLIDQLRGHRIGLVIFAGEAFVQCPLTMDYAAAKILLREVSVESIPVGGTAIRRALNKALESFPPGSPDTRAIILITDGEDTHGDPIQAATRARDAGVVIYTLGVGDPAGVPIPIRDQDGTLQGYVRDRQGNIHTTRANEFALHEMSRITGGLFFPIRQADFGLMEIMEHLERTRQQQLLETQMMTQFEERFQVFLLPALALLLVGMLLSDRKSLLKRASAQTHEPLGEVKQ